MLLMSDSLSTKMLRELFLPFERKQLGRLPFREQLLLNSYEEFHDPLNLLRETLKTILEDNETTKH